MGQFSRKTLDKRQVSRKTLDKGQVSRKNLKAKTDLKQKKMVVKVITEQFLSGLKFFF